MSNYTQQQSVHLAVLAESLESFPSVHGSSGRVDFLGGSVWRSGCWLIGITTLCSGFNQYWCWNMYAAGPTPLIHNGYEFVDSASITALRSCYMAVFWAAYAFCAQRFFLVVFPILCQQDAYSDMHRHWLGFALILAVLRVATAVPFLTGLLNVHLYSDVLFKLFEAASMMYTCIATPIYFRALLRRALPPERHYLAPRVSLLSACIYMSFLSWQAGKFGMPGGFTMSIAFMCTGGLAVAVVLFVQTMKHTVSSIRGHIDLAYLFFAAPFITRAVAQGSTLIAVELSARMSDVNTFLVPPAFALFMSILTIVLTEAVPLVFPRDPDMWMCLFFRVAQESISTSIALSSLQTWKHLGVYCVLYAGLISVQDIGITSLIVGWLHNAAAVLARKPVVSTPLVVKEMPTIRASSSILSSASYASSSQALRANSNGSHINMADRRLSVVKADASLSLPIVQPSPSLLLPVPPIKPPQQQQQHCSPTCPHAKYQTMVQIAVHNALGRTLAFICHAAGQAVPWTGYQVLVPDGSTFATSRLAVIAVLFTVSIASGALFILPMLVRQGRQVKALSPCTPLYPVDEEEEKQGVSLAYRCLVRVKLQSSLSFSLTSLLVLLVVCLCFGPM